MTTNRDAIQAYYGTVLNSTQDLNTGACCTTESLPSHLRALVGEIHPEVTPMLETAIMVSP